MRASSWTRLSIAWERLEQNLKRASGLLNMYESLKRHRRGRPPTPISDLLRAATVFLHASLEEFLRSVAAEYWPKGDSRVLDDIPLVGNAPATKHTILALAKHRGKTVDSLLRESVHAYLLTASFNDTRQICGFLETVGINASIIEDLLPDLQDLMERRHNIVHQADRNVAPRRGHHRTKAISEKRVGKWLGAVVLLAARISHQLEPTT